MKKLVSVIIAFLLVITFSGITQAYSGYNYTMSWSFQTFNNPNARQVAINTAETQDGLVDSVDDSIQDFTDGLERRLYSSAQREIVDIIMGRSDIPYGEFDAGNLSISVAEDPQTGEVIVEIIDKITGDSTIITYSDDYFGGDFGGW